MTLFRGLQQTNSQYKSYIHKQSMLGHHRREHYSQMSPTARDFNLRKSLFELTIVTLILSGLERRRHFNVLKPQRSKFYQHSDNNHGTFYRYLRGTGYFVTLSKRGLFIARNTKGAPLVLHKQTCLKHCDTHHGTNFRNIYDSRKFRGFVQK